jgi:hypothetical protein
MKSQIDCLKSAPFQIDYRLKIDHRDYTNSSLAGACNYSFPTPRATDFRVYEVFKELNAF